MSRFALFTADWPKVMCSRGERGADRYFGLLWAKNSFRPFIENRRHCAAFSPAPCCLRQLWRRRKTRRLLTKKLSKAKDFWQPSAAGSENKPRQSIHHLKTRAKRSKALAAPPATLPNRRCRGQRMRRARLHAFLRRAPYRGTRNASWHQTAHRIAWRLPMRSARRKASRQAAVST